MVWCWGVSCQSATRTALPCSKEHAADGGAPAQGNHANAVAGASHNGHDGVEDAGADVGEDASAFVLQPAPAVDACNVEQENDNNCLETTHQRLLWMRENAHSCE